MPLAIFGIENTALSLAVTLAILILVAIWIALVVFTFTDSRRRIADPFLVGCATAASFFPFVGTIVYTILRPPEFLEDVRERETEVKADETRLRHLEFNSCHKCGFPAQTDFVRCPACRTRLKQPCESCSRPVGIKWKVCPYCEHTLIESKRSSRRTQPKEKERTRSRTSGKRPDPEARKPGGETAPAPKKSTRSSSGSSPRGESGEGAPRRSSSRGARKKVEEPTRADSPERAPEGERRPSRSSRTSRVQVNVPDEEAETGEKPINGGDSTSPGRRPERS
jgi:hypothetical protein